MDTRIRGIFTLGCAALLFSLGCQQTPPTTVFNPPYVPPPDPPVASPPPTVVTGRVLDSQTRLPIGQAQPAGLRISPEGEYDLSTGTFEVTQLSQAITTLTFTTAYPITSMFPGLAVYRDTTIDVHVSFGEIVVIPDVLLQPRSPLLLVGVSTCPVTAPPQTPADLADCDGGYWGGADVKIEVDGIIGTSTEGIHLEGRIRPTQTVGPAEHWDLTNYSTTFDIAIPGEYDVRMVESASVQEGVILQLVPWQTEVVRVSVGPGVRFVGFDFWHEYTFPG